MGIVADSHCIPFSSVARFPQEGVRDTFACTKIEIIYNYISQHRFYRRPGDKAGTDSPGKNTRSPPTGRSMTFRQTNRHTVRNFCQ